MQGWVRKISRLFVSRVGKINKNSCYNNIEGEYFALATKLNDVTLNCNHFHENIIFHSVKQDFYEKLIKKGNFDKRLDALSVFDLSVQDFVDREKISVTDCGNAQKNTIKLLEFHQSSKKSKNLFTKKENQFVFNFQHFLNTEEIIDAYSTIKSNYRVQSRKLNKKKLITALSVTTNSEDKNSNSIEVESVKESTEDVKSGYFARQTSSHERSPKIGRNQQIKRISATKNFVYDFENPLNLINVEKKNPNLEATAKTVNSKVNQKGKLSTLPSVFQQTNSKNDAKKRNLNYRPPINQLPSISNNFNINSRNKLKLSSINRKIDEKSIKPSSTMKYESNWQKIRQQGNLPKNIEPINQKNDKMKNIHENFEKLKLTETLPNDKNSKKPNFQNLLKKNSKTEQTYRIPKITDTTEKSYLKKNFQLDGKKSQSTEDEYFAKFAQKMENLKEESKNEKSSSLNKEEINDLFREINIFETGFREMGKKNLPTVDKEVQSSNRLSFEEKEKIVRKLLPNELHVDGNNDGNFSKEIKKKFTHENNSEVDMLSRILKSDYLKQQLNL